jgi:hypothetical protein
MRNDARSCRRGRAFGFGLGGGRRVETDDFRGATVIHGLGEDQASKGDAPYLNELSATRTRGGSALTTSSRETGFW